MRRPRCWSAHTPAAHCASAIPFACRCPASTRREGGWTWCRPRRRNDHGWTREGTLMAKGRKRKIAAGDVASNRQASFRYNLMDRFECGLVLTGTEVKSLRESGAQLKDAYAVVRDDEVWLVGMHIAPYGPAARENHDPDRTRKLLLHRREIDRLIGRTREPGLTQVSTRGCLSAAASGATSEVWEATA